MVTGQGEGLEGLVEVPAEDFAHGLPTSILTTDQAGQQSDNHTPGDV